MKYNGNIYSRQVMEFFFKTHEYTRFFTYKPLGELFYPPNPHFDAFCCINNYSIIISFIRPTREKPRFFLGTEMTPRPPHRQKTMRPVWKVQVIFETIFLFLRAYVPATQWRHEIDSHEVFVMSKPLFPCLIHQVLCRLYINSST